MDGAFHYTRTSFCGSSTVWQNAALSMRTMPMGACMQTSQHHFFLTNFLNIASSCCQSHKIAMRLKPSTYSHVNQVALSQSIDPDHPLLPATSICHRRKKFKIIVQMHDAGKALDTQGIPHLELEVLKFMEASDQPDKFPAKLDLLRAGRADLVNAILAEGGWLAVGWNLESNDTCEMDDVKIQHLAMEHFSAGVEDNNRMSENKNVGEVKMQGETIVSSNLGGNYQGSDGLLGAAAYRKTGPKKAVDTERGTQLSVTKSNPDIVTRVATHGGSSPPLLGQVSEGKGSSDCSRQCLKDGKRRKTRKLLESHTMNLNMHQAFHRVNEKVKQRNRWVSKAKLETQENLSGEKSKEEPNVISSNIHGLETELIAMFNTLQLGRCALAQDKELKQVPEMTEELERLSDALEFRETDLIRTRKELRTARAQLAALQGKNALELIEAWKTLEAKDQKLKKSMEVLKSMRTARIVWASPGSEVFLAGSFDGWTNWRKMEKSNAGVFVTALQLYPGCYEIKFIVDGEWKVDPNRPVINSNGFQNNLLTIY